MSDRLIIEVDGIEELQKKLAIVETQAVKSIFRKNLRKALRPILSQAKNNVPVKTGFLKKNIKMRPGRHSQTSVGIVISTKQGKGNLYVGDTYYAGMVHDGHDVLSLKDKGKGTDEALKRRRAWFFANYKLGNVIIKGITQTKARPFIKDAYEQNKQSAAQQIRDGIWSDIEAIWNSRQQTFFSEGYM